MTTQTWSQQWRLFIQFCRKPCLAPRQRRVVTPHAGWLQDWRTGVSWTDLLKWCVALWLINLFVLGPLVISVAEQIGATHSINPKKLPWFLALIWAPLIEEMLFRFGLRRPVIALWLVPLMVMGIWNGPGVIQSVLYSLAVYLIYRSTKSTVVPGTKARRWLRHYSQWFGWVFHLSVALFAGMHLFNYTFDEIAIWMLPVLVLPQWATGLVLGWFRVMHGIGASIRLHALFNLGPLLLAWLALWAMPA